MTYTLSPGHRVTWCNDYTEVKAQITRVWKHKAEILTTDFQRLKVPLEELELVPPVKPKGDRSSDRWNPNDFGEVNRQVDPDGQGLIFFDTSNEPPDPDDFYTTLDYELAWEKWHRDRSSSVREQETDCTLTPSERDRALHPNSWIEEKLIRRSGKLHGPYLYERWRDAQGKMKSKYLGKKKD